jgi:hypothetical protein
MVAWTVGCTPITKNAPHGTYTATILGIKQTITFSGDTITRYDVLGGKVILKYRLNGPATEATDIWIQDVATGASDRVPFKYIPDQDIVVFGALTYYK